MKILYLDASAGVSGDMLLAALLDMGLPARRVRSVINAIGLPHLRFFVERVQKQGQAAARVIFRQEGSGNGSFRRAADGYQRLRGAVGLSGSIRENLKKILSALARAEARVHGVSPALVRFHQVGTPDTLAVWAGICAGFDHFQVKALYCSDIPIGRFHLGHHGEKIFSPGPATRLLLRDFRTRLLAERFERTTPTGAAVLSALGSPGSAPVFALLKIGNGTGQKSPPDGHGVLRLFLGKTG
ncbi:MAG: LarC family nickel insertion protein [Candidatus Omnitrophica bacterium]|nr:LarC family nickel insertion protein [Candidatus Omnitrophota bacterium]